MNVHTYSCPTCGRSVILGARCDCNVVFDRVVAALERIASALERIAGDGRHAQPIPFGPVITHLHGPTES